MVNRARVLGFHASSSSFPHLLTFLCLLPVVSFVRSFPSLAFAHSFTLLITKLTTRTQRKLGECGNEWKEEWKVGEEQGGGTERTARTVTTGLGKGVPATVVLPLFSCRLILFDLHSNSRVHFLLSELTANTADAIREWIRSKARKWTNATKCTRPLEPPEPWES